MAGADFDHCPCCRVKEIFQILKHLSRLTSIHGSMRLAVCEMASKGSLPALFASPSDMEEVEDAGTQAETGPQQQQARAKSSRVRHAQMVSKVDYIEENFEVAHRVFSNMRSLLTDREFGAYLELRCAWHNERVTHMRRLLEPFRELAAKAGDEKFPGARAAEEAIALIQDDLIKNGISYLSNESVLKVVEESYSQLASSSLMELGVAMQRFEADDGDEAEDPDASFHKGKIVGLFKALLCPTRDDGDAKMGPQDACRVRTLIESIMLSSSQKFHYGQQNALRMTLKLAGCPPSALDQVHARTMSVSTKKAFDSHELKETALRNPLVLKPGINKYMLS